MKRPTLPDGLTLKIRDNAFGTSAGRTYEPGHVLPEGITIESPLERPEITIDSDRVALHKATLLGAGIGTIHIKGNGPGTAIRKGHGHGDAIRSGLGDGDAIRRGPEEYGDAKRMGNGLGNALREGTGPGDALRHGMGGDAVRTGPGPGTATLREEQRTTLRHRLMMAAGKLGMAATIAITVTAHTHAQPIAGTTERNHVDRPAAELRMEPPAHKPPGTTTHQIDGQAAIERASAAQSVEPDREPGDEAEHRHGIPKADTSHDFDHASRGSYTDAEWKEHQRLHHQPIMSTAGARDDAAAVEWRADKANEEVSGVNAPQKAALDGPPDRQLPLNPTQLDVMEDHKLTPNVPTGNGTQMDGHWDADERREMRRDQAAAHADNQARTEARDHGAEHEPDAVQHAAAELAEANRVHEPRSHTGDAIALGVAGTGAAMTGIGVALGTHKPAPDGEPHAPGRTPHADHDHGAGHHRDAEQARDKSSHDRPTAKHKTNAHGDHHEHGSQKGHGAGHKAHHEHLPEEERERRRVNGMKRNAPLQEGSSGQERQSVKEPRTRLQRILHQHRAHRRSSDPTSHEPESTRARESTAAPKGQHKNAEWMPSFRKGHVNPTPPKAPPPADAAARESGMSRSTQDQTR